MKQSPFVTKLAMFFLFIAVVAYLLTAAWQHLFNPFTTVLAYGDSYDDAAKATGWLVREETVLPAGNGIVVIVPDEGERLGVGQTVAFSYRDEAALERRQTIRTLELEQEQLEYSLRQGDSTAQAGKLDEDIYSAMNALHAAGSNQNFAGLDDQILLLKSMVFRREYSRTTGQTTDLSTLAASVSAQIASLQSASVQDTTSITVDRSGIYSGLVDGYEDIFTPSAITDLTVSGLSALAAASPRPDSASVGKLITASKWYFTAALSEADADRLIEGATVMVAFTRDFSGDIPMRVEHLSKPEDGKVAAVLSSTRNLSDITLLRKQTVDIVFSRQNGIRVPKKALRVQSDGATGVYVIAGVTAEFKQVVILAEGEDYYLLASVAGADPGRVLRAGDEVILAAADLYDGKVVR